MTIPQTFVDKLEIAEKLKLYALAVDTQNWNLLDDVFTPDAEIAFPGQQWTSLDDWKADFAAVHLPFEATQHIITVMAISVDGDRASSICYGDWLLIRKLGADKAGEWRGQGWYEDQHVRTPQGWRVCQRSTYQITSEGNLKETPDEHQMSDALVASIRGEFNKGGLPFLRR